MSEVPLILMDFNEKEFTKSELRIATHFGLKCFERTETHYCIYVEIDNQIIFSKIETAKA